MSDKWVSTSSRHLIITRRASIIILISVITTGAIVTLILKSQWRWRGNRNETTHDSLSSCDTTNTSVHLTKLITKSARQASMRTSYAMMASSVTPLAEDEGAEVDRAVEARGAAVCV